MNSRAIQEAATSPARAAAVRAELDRILGSRIFRSSGRLSRFLRHIVGLTLAGRAIEIKEYAIGVEVCERGENFDPRIDPIVRIDARRLRARLCEYYETEGASAALRIRLEPGTYVPSFDAREPAPAPAPSRAPVRSVAVLPLQNLGGGPDEDAVCEGLTEALVTALAQTAGLRVVSGRSWSAFQDRAPDPREVAEVLRVGGIVEGSVQHIAVQWRVTLRLVAAVDGAVLWSRAFDSSGELPFQLQDEIGRALCRQLGVIEWPAKPERPIPDAAWNLYSKARHQLLKWKPDAVARAVEWFEAAIDESPEFARAYAGLASARCWLGLYGVSRPRELLLPARFAAEKAIAIEPATAEAWAAVGTVRAIHDWDWAAADRDFERALSLNSVDGMVSYAAFLAFQGRLRESQQVIDRAMAADPVNLVVRSQQAITLAFGGDDQAAVRLHLELLDIEPRFARAHWALGIAYSRLGNFPEALRHYEAARAAIGDAPFLLGWHGHCLALAGARDEALALEAQLARLRETRFVPSFAAGMIRLGMGDREGALDRFTEAVEERAIWTLEFRMSDTFRPLRGHPRFQALLERMRLA